MIDPQKPETLAPENTDITTSWTAPTLEIQTIEDVTQGGGGGGGDFADEAS